VNVLGRLGTLGHAGKAIRVDWVDLERVPGLRGAAAAGGALGMTFAPGKRDWGLIGLHDRDLAADVATLRDAERVDVFVLLIEDHELASLRITGLPDVMSAAGIELIRHPIRDGGVPVHRSAFRALLDDLLARLTRGQRIVVACRGGLGRTGTLVGCLLRDGGLSGRDAIDLTRASRHRTIEWAVQEQFVEGWE
jgi:protein-tyrosine phosphatase